MVKNTMDSDIFFFVIKKCIESIVKLIGNIGMYERILLIILHLSKIQIILI